MLRETDPSPPKRTEVSPVFNGVCGSSSKRRQAHRPNCGARSFNVFCSLDAVVIRLLGNSAGSIPKLGLMLPWDR